LIPPGPTHRHCHLSNHVTKNLATLLHPRRLHDKQPPYPAAAFTTLLPSAPSHPPTATPTSHHHPSTAPAYGSPPHYCILLPNRPPEISIGSMPSLLEHTRHSERDLVPIPLGCAQSFHNDVQNSSAVSDELSDDLLVRQPLEFNSFTREFQDRTITRSSAPAAAELRHQMLHRDRNIKTELVVLQIQYPQTRFSTAKSLQPTLNECLLLAARKLSMGK
jgi:hypothetical protein